MTYHFQPCDRVLVPSWTRIGLPLGDRRGTVREFLPRTGHPGPDGIRCDRVRVKLDRHPRPLLFNANDVEPV